MRALVLSGGGSHGAWQAGVVCELMKRATKHCTGVWDAVYGVSVGAINALAVGAEFSPDDIEQFWESVRGSSDIYKWPHFWSPLTTPWRQSLYTAKPLVEFLDRAVPTTIEFGRPTYVGLTNLDSGDFELHELTSDRARTINLVAASAAYPMAFEPVIIDGSRYLDGGLRNITPLKSAIDAGATNIDVVTCTASGLGRWTGANHFLDVGLRALNILIDEVLRNDLEVCDRVSENVMAGLDYAGHRLVLTKLYQPSISLDDIYDSLDFSPDKIAQAFAQGTNDAI